MAKQIPEIAKVLRQIWPMAAPGSGAALKSQSEEWRSIRARVFRFMHRDVKLGLALGMLVIGFAAAFCFPRQSGFPLAANPVSGSAALSSSQELVSARTYQQHAEPMGPGDEADGSAPAASSGGEDVLPTAMETLELEKFASAVDETPGPGPASTQSAMNNQNGSAPTVRDSPLGTPRLVNSPQIPPTTYTVQAGDTLSSIAHQLLGSSLRAGEIFDSNTHQLESPHKLRLGMVLRIPGVPVPGADVQPAPVARSNPSPISPAVEGEPALPHVPVLPNGTGSDIRLSQEPKGTLQ